MLIAGFVKGKVARAVRIRELISSLPKGDAGDKSHAFR